MNTKLLSSSNLPQKPASNCFQKFLLAFLFLAIGNSVFAQVSAYQQEQLQLSSYADLDVTTKTQIHTGAWNDAVTQIPIGFTFQFNGTNYTNVNVSSNGFITFGATAPTANNYNPISSTQTYAGAVAGYGRDLLVASAAGTPQANSVSYFLDATGGAGNRILKIEWRAARRLATDTGNISFQIWLYETTNVVEIRYAVQTTAFTANVLGEIGLRGNVNTDFNNLVYPATANWPALPAVMAAGTANTDVVGIRSGANRIVAASNRLFRWTPVSCFAPTAVVVSDVAASTATVTWTAPSTVPSGGYQYYIATSATAPTAGTTPTGTSATNSLNLTGLSGNTTYYIYIRSNCGGSNSSWTAVSSFTTLCPAVNIPYFLYFDPFSDGFTVPALPACTTRQQVGSGNLWVTDATSEEGFFDEHLVYNASGTQAANVWFYTRGINVVAGNTYRLSYVYGGSTNFSTIVNKMKVAYGTSPLATSMTTILADHNNIKASPISTVINFTATTTQTIYIGFHAYSALNMGKLFLDDIEVVEAICRPLTAATISNISYNSATATWTAPSPAPASGYMYYLSTSPTAPAYNAVPTGSTPAGVITQTLTGLTGSTTYYFWVRANCGDPDLGEWSPVATFTTLATPPYCIPPAVTDTSSPINNVTTTNAITNINNSSGYVAPGYSDYTNLLITEAQGGTFNFSVAFNASGGVGVAIYIDWNGDGTFNTTNERVYNSNQYLFSSPITGTITVPLTATLGVTRMRVVADYWATSPQPCAINLNGSTRRGEIEDYSFKVVVQPPALTITPTSGTQCAGSNSQLITLTSPIGNYNVYSWSPNIGVTGNATTGWIINSETSLTYTLTGQQTYGDFSQNTATFTYQANPLPTPITITTTPTGGTVCQDGTPIMLTASGGVVSGVPVFSDDFNTGAPGWITENLGTGGNVAAASWTLRPNNYDPVGGSWGSTILSSNDQSTFWFSDNDAQGSGNPNNNKLISPSFSLAGYTAASLSFWHYYRSWNPSNASVQISTNSTTGLDGTWTTLLSTNTTQGTPTNFANVVLDLNPYVGQSNIRIRFHYTATWGWGWAIDNFVVSGSATSAITWSPIAGLFSDAAGNSPYVAGTGTQVVYALPSATQIYTASASTPSPTVCTTSTSTTVTVTPVGGGTISPLSQAVCGSPSDIVATGFTGTITGWQWSTTSNFATPNNIPGSASPTLTSAQIGTFSGIRYYRAVVTNAGCTSYIPTLASGTQVVVSYSSTTWNGAWSNGVPTITTAAIFTANYTATGNLSACSVQVTGGNVVINPGVTLTVQNGVTVSGGTLTFEDDSSLLQNNAAATNSGNITYKRITTPMKKFDFTYWSTPVSPQTLGNLSPNTLADKYFWWNPSIYNWESIAAPGITNMTPGRGYIIRAPETFTSTAQPYTGSFVGVPNNGNITIPIVVSGANDLNLIGNPYPSAIDADLLLSPSGPNAGRLAGTLYFWTHNTAITNYNYSGGDYATYNFTGGTGSGAPASTGGSVPDGDIAAGQGFFAKGSSSGNVTFTNSMRIPGDNGDFFRSTSTSQQSSSALEKHRLWLDISNNAGLYKQALVGYIQTATNEIDAYFDGEYMDAGNPVAIYSILGDDKLSIQGRALPFSPLDLVPVGFKTPQAGTYQISLSNFDGLFVGQDVYLEDTSLNIIHDLKAAAYSFTTTGGVSDDRFVLRFTNGTALGTNVSMYSDDTVVVFKNQSGINIKAVGSPMKSVTIYDIRGRAVYSNTAVNANNLTISNLNVQEQVLVVQVISADGVVVNKKIVY